MKGLTTEQIEKFRNEFGANILTPAPRKSWYAMLFDGFKDPLIIILIAAACVSLFIGVINNNYLEPVGILSAIGLAVGIGFWNTYSASKKFDLLLTASDDILVKVYRDNTVINVPRKELVVNDVIILEAGEEIPADCNLLEARNCKVDESSLTGESVPVEKLVNYKENKEDSYPKNKLYKGTVITEGHAEAIITGVGDNTEIGKTARTASEITGVETPLNKQLNKLAGLINKIAFGAATILIISLVGKYFFIDTAYVGKDVLGIVNDLLQFLMIAVALIVAAVPEGLPMAVTLALAYSMKRMANDNNLIKKMHACETLGAVNTIFTDKTGTLTENKMSVVGSACYDSDKLFDFSSITDNMLLNSTAFRNVGNPTESALLRYTGKNDEEITEYRNKFGIHFRKDFNSKNKYMITVTKHPHKSNYIVYIKGAPEIVSKMCKPHDHGEEWKSYMEKGNRCIMFASMEINDPKEMDKLDAAGIFNMDVQMNGFEYNGFAAIADPIRSNVHDAIQQAHNAGIFVKIITGDNPLTAKEIGRQAGISENPNTFVGATDKLTMEDISGIDVFARARPDDKQKLIKECQNNGLVVAMTGDGTNDAPALNYADVGIAMNNGTDIAKEAADVVLLDNSFPSIITGIKWGRSLYKNIQHFIIFQLTINVVVVLTALVGPFIGVNLPFTVTQMLWVNLIMDTFAALALASEPANDEVMNDKPRNPEDFIITKDMWKTIIFYGMIYFFILIGLLVTNFCSLTAFFTIFVMLQWWNLFSTRVYGQRRSIFDNIWKNKTFIIIVLLILLGQILIVQFGGELFRTEPMPFTEWIYIIGCTSIITLLREYQTLHNKIFNKC